MLDLKEIIRNNKDDIIKPTAVLLAICIIIPLALSVTNWATVKKITLLEEENRNKSMSSLVIADEYTPSEIDGEEFFKAQKSGKTEAYIFTVTEKGYGGEISVMTAVDADGEIIGISVLDASNETPGLGQNVTKAEFFSQYRGLKGVISVLKNGADSKKNEVDAVTGATISSTAVTRAVNRALELYGKLDADSLTEVTSNEK